jgi:poly-gamma-glutamate synthesis protein (capsule biosynthesis protein)
MAPNVTPAIRLFLCGDVMTGRGMDQILPSPGTPLLRESYLQDARSYVDLAEQIHGAIPKPVSDTYPWGDALPLLHQPDCDARIINLETSITRSSDFWPGKGIHYRMHPGNISCLISAKIDCCCLANNHILDFGYRGLQETLESLDQAGIAHAGAGSNASEAAAPAVIEIPQRGRVLVFAFGMSSSGIPLDWQATHTRPGINPLPDLSEKTARRIAREMLEFQCSGDLIIASIHWGPNWDLPIHHDERTFARRLIDHGISLLHGHSSHHVKPMEIHNGRLILHGCGDFINDYEGIRGHEDFRPDLRLAYLVNLDPQDGSLLDLQLQPLQMRCFRLQTASAEDAGWLCRLLNPQDPTSGLIVEPAHDGSLRVRTGA